MMRSRKVLALVLVAGIGVAMLAGCARKPEVISAWPVADSERIVPQPPEPLRWPLTGLSAPDQASIAKRPLSVKIENSPQARPQTGLNSADVIYETVTEGGITRFNCIFQSTVPPTIGPVRSARLSDLWVVPQYHALFFFSGASSSVNSAVKSAKLPSLSEDAGVSAPYFRSRQRSAPHNLFLDTKKAYAEAAKRGMPVTAEVPRLQFAPKAAETSNTVTSVSIPFSQANRVLWTYDAGKKAYLRQNNGRSHIDAGTGKQVISKNVVVLWTKYTAVSRDKVGSTTYRVELGGSGRASVFRDGKRYDGTWTATRDAPPHFKDAQGKAIRLAPGNTWFQVIPLNTNIAMK
jgi:hypothetical protein